MIRLNGVDVPSTANVPSSVSQGTYHLAANPNLFEIQRSNNFEFIVTDIDGILRPGVVGTEQNAKFNNAQELIRLSVATSSVPTFTQEAIPVKRGNSTMKFAGTANFSEGSIKIHDYIGANTKEVLMAWQNLSYNVATDKVGLASDYKKQCYLIEQTPDGQKVRQWKMHGCWISGLSIDQFDNGANNEITVTATIQYDRAELDQSTVV